MSLPEILKVRTLPTIENMEIKTEVLDPITSSNQECIFQIPKNGMLDGGSFVSLAVRCSAAASAAGHAFFPLQTGIHSLVQSAYLMVGSKVVASTEDYGHYTTMIRQFDSPEHRANVDMVKSGASMDRFNSVDATTGRLMPKDLVYGVFAADNTARATVPLLSKPTDSDATTPVFSVPLSSLIPMMRTRKLPLYAMKENVFLRLVFKQQANVAGDVGNICCMTNGHGVDSSIVPSLINIKFYSDHLYFKDGSMDRLQSQIFSEQGLSYIYEDSVLTNTQLPQTANPTSPAIQEQRIERDIAVSGKTVRSILIQQKETGKQHPLMGLYHSESDLTDAEYNYRINEQRYYDRDIVNPAHKYNELRKVLGKPLAVPSLMYSLEPDTNKAAADHTLNQNSMYIGQIEAHQLPDGGNTDRTNDIRGLSHYTGVDLTTTGFNVLGNGKRVGVKPITYQALYKRTHDKRAARTLRFFSNVERVITIKNGDVVVSA